VTAVARPRGAKARAEPTVEVLRELYPDAHCALDHANAYELLAATILSAQSTDMRVNMVTPTLFAKYPTPADLAVADPAEVETIVQSTGFFRAKARSLLGMSKALVEAYDGRVPPDIDALVMLPGVGRKTANVVLGHALGVPGLPVDRHVLRVANRIGLAESDDPETVEAQLCGALPKTRWTRASDTLILHGRRICRPQPLCDQCAVQDDCAYYRSSSKDRTPEKGRASRGSRKSPGAKGPRKSHDARKVRKPRR